MRISLSELDQFLLNPEEWARKKLYSSGSPRMSYAHLTRMGVFKFHKTGSPTIARESLIGYLDSFHLSNSERRAQAEEQLTSYIDWATSAKPTVVHVAPSVRVDLGSGLYTSGQIHRVDIDLASGGYRAVMLGAGMLSSSDPRAAVVQQGYAGLTGRHAGLVIPTHQNLDGTSLSTIPVSAKKSKEVLRELAAAARTAAAILARG